MSPSGKAADSDSVISRVQILTPQPISREWVIGIPDNPFSYIMHISDPNCRSLIAGSLRFAGVYFSSRYCSFAARLADPSPSKHGVDPNGQGCVIARSTVSEVPSIKTYSVVNVLHIERLLVETVRYDVLKKASPPVPMLQTLN